ncbi:MAG: RNA repair domain-containing protein [Thermoplasmata archaeon]
MTDPREVLNEIKWRDDRSLKGVEIFYVHRGAEGDYKIIKGDEVVNLGRSFMELEDGGHIPYHRIFQIVKNGEVLLSRDRS